MCGVHSKKTQRESLPENPNKQANQEKKLKDDMTLVTERMDTGVHLSLRNRWDP
jgi:hypothetical protein